MMYEIYFPPVYKSYMDLSKKEAEELFQWYINVIPERVEYVRCVCSDYLKIDKNQLDLSADSLLPIWKWFLATVKTKRTSNRYLDNICKSYEYCPRDLQEYMENPSKVQYSLESETMMRDIGLYLGSVFINEHPEVYWTFYVKPKRDMFVNKPLLQGFKDYRFCPPFSMSFEPVHMVWVQASNIWYKTQHEDDLYRLYKKWEQYVDDK